MFQQLFWHSWFRVHFKTLFFKTQHQRDLEFQKTCIKIQVTTGAINVKKKPFGRGGHIIVQRIPLTQVKMQKSFNSLLIKFNVSTQETCCQNFFSSRLYVREFFGGQ